MKKWILVIALFVVAAALAACGQDDTPKTGSSNSGTEEQHLRLNLGGEPYTLDPAFASDTTSWWVIDSIYSGLYRKGENGEPVLELAKSVDVSEDGKTYTFTLHEGLEWSNGDSLTAHDFEYAWKRVLNPETAAYSPSSLYFIEGAEAYNLGEATAEEVGIEATNDTTLVVQLVDPINFFPKIATGSAYYPVNQKVVEADDKWATEAETLVSNGAFKMKTWDHNAEIILEKNDVYVEADEVKLDIVSFQMVADANTEFQLYKSGEIDVLVTVPADMLTSVKDDEELVTYEGFSVSTYSFNVDEKPVNNEKIRQAFSYAIDRQAFVDNVLKGGQKPAYGYVSYGVVGEDGKDYRDSAPEEYYTFDPEKAQKLLAEGLQEEGLTELPAVTLKTNAEGVNKKSAEVVQEMLKQNLGIEITIETQEWKTYIDTFKQKNFQVARMGWVGDFLDPYPVLALYRSTSSSNFTNWKNEKFDQLLDKSLQAKTEKERFEILHEAESILMKELPILPINFSNENSLIRKTVEGITTDPLSKPNFIFAEIKE